jgi:hypothetical protein
MPSKRPQPEPNQRPPALNRVRLLFSVAKRLCVDKPVRGWSASLTLPDYGRVARDSGAIVKVTG